MIAPPPEPLLDAFAKEGDGGELRNLRWLASHRRALALRPYPHHPA
jgi:hypothetical protein